MEQKSEETMDVLDKEGLSINLDVTIIFKPYYDEIGYLHENIGISYVSAMVIPNVRSFQFNASSEDWSMFNGYENKH